MNYLHNTVAGCGGIVFSFNYQHIFLQYGKIEGKRSKCGNENF